MRRLLTALALAACAPAAQAQDAPAPAPEMSHYYPIEANRLEVQGSAMLECRVQASGQVHQCTVLEETPPDQGFGAAALRMSRLFKMKPPDDGSSHEGAKVRIPLKFKIPPEDIAAPAAEDAAEP